MRPHRSAAALILGLSCALSAVSLEAVEVWDRLPAETVYAARIPAGAPGLQALLASDFGDLLLGPESRSSLCELLREGDEPWPTLVGLGDAVFADAGIGEIIAGESGLALLRQTPLDSEPRVALLGWWQPDEAVRSRFVAVEEHWDAAVADGSLAGYERQAFTCADREGWTVDAELEGDQARFFVLKDTGRFFLGLVEVQDWEHALGQLEGLLVEAVPTEPFRARVETVPGLVASLPAGTVIAEAYFDPTGIWHFDDPEDAAQFSATGLDGLGPMATRMTVREDLLHAGAYVSMPAPRRGLLAMLEQPPLMPEPPPWVPAEAITYDHISFDLNIIWRGITEIWRGLQGAEAEQYIQMAEQYMQNTFGHDLPTVLGAFGNQVIGLRLPDLPDLPEPQESGGQAAEATEAETAPVVEETVDADAEAGGLAAVEAGDEVAEAAEGEPAVAAEPDPFGWNDRLRMAWVWELRDEAIAKQVLTVMGSFMMMGIQEQEVRMMNRGRWSGYRIGPEGAEQGGVLVGHGQLLVAVGRGMLDRLADGIADGQAGDGGLLTSPAMIRALTILPAEPGIYWSMQDAGLLAEQAAEQIPTMFDEIDLTDILLEVGSPGDDVSGLVTLIPDPERLGASLGLAITNLVLGGRGLRLDTVWELREVAAADGSGEPAGSDAP